MTLPALRSPRVGLPRTHNRQKPGSVSVEQDARDGSHCEPGQRHANRDTRSKDQRSSSPLCRSAETLYRWTLISRSPASGADAEMKVQTTTLRYLNTRIERLKQCVLRAAAKRST